MRLNETTILIGDRLLLVPYLKEHVATYHEWMKSPELLETTASEPLSLEEEYEMQLKWLVDEDKLTFIVLARPTTNDAPIDLSACPMIGDVNMFFHEPEEEGGLRDAECEVMIAETAYRRKGLALEALSLLLRYATSSSLGLGLPKSSNLLAKISTSNGASRALFERLGFGVVKTSEVWQEWELRFGVDGMEEEEKGRRNASPEWAKEGQEVLRTMVMER